jgi:outer membrane protein assembly factor BamD (BamD/ComL family)
MTNMRNLSLKLAGFRESISKVVVVSLLLVLAGCTTERYYYAQDESELMDTYDRAQRLYERGRYDDAEGYFLQVVLNYSESSLVEVAMYYLGRCYQKKGEYEKAISTYQDFINKYPDSTWTESAKKEIEEIGAVQKRR